MTRRRIAWIAAACALVPAAAAAQPEGAARDVADVRPATLEALRREVGRSVLDVPYAATGNPRHRLDVYLPKRPESDALPVIVFFHGGGWLEGDKTDEAGRLLPWLRSGRYAGVSASYRLSSEATWPAQIHDCKAAIRWIRANARRYGLDPERIGVWGTSAGAHLALMLGVSAGVPELEGDLGPHRSVSSRVAAVVNFFGPTDLLAEIGQPSAIDRTRADAPEAKLVGGPLLERRAEAWAASPTSYVSADDAPILTVHGSADPIVPYEQGVRIDRALRRAGVPSHFVRIEGGGHGDFGTAADERVDAFLTRYLLGRPVEVSDAPIPYPSGPSR